jgi:diphthamide synthase (EF-2-diphthine--ammonia ligase)
MKQRGIDYAVYGDIFLEDLKKYREEKLAESSLTGVFPLWKIPSIQVYKEFVSFGYKAVIICVDESKLGKEFLGRTLDMNLLNEFPAGVDCCGENGEFHTFSYEGPIFKRLVAFSKGEMVRKTYTSPEGKEEMGFWFLDLLPE